MGDRRRPSWRRGDSTAEGAKQQWRENRQVFQTNFDRIRDLHRQGRITSQQADDWEQIARMDDDAFEALLEDGIPPAGKLNRLFGTTRRSTTRPSRWWASVGIEARAYCAWLSAQTGQTFRLPTEAEWEAAARGRTGRRYAYGDDVRREALQRLRDPRPPDHPGRCLSRRRDAGGTAST